ncbi:hypothetical protein CL634_09710 [bacterium]|jgi:hypothetical protein|nr:hypothetical protein [bacterium]
MPDVKQTISDFYRVAQERDFQRDFQFRVLNIQSGDGAFAVTEDDLVYAQGGTVPGRTIASTDVAFMGLAFKVPGGATYGGTYELTFYSDREDSLRQLFLQWTRDTFDEGTSSGNYYMPRDTSVVDLVQLDTQLNRVAQYTLVGAFPTTVGDISYNVQGTGAPVTFSVTLGYHFIKSQLY